MRHICALKTGTALNDIGIAMHGLVSHFADEERSYTKFRTGLLVTPKHERVNTPEERAFLDEIYAKYDRDNLPNSWDSRAKGNEFILFK